MLHTSLLKRMEVSSFWACSCCCLICGPKALQRDSGKAPMRENQGLRSFFLALATLTASSFSEGCMAAAHCILEWSARVLSHNKEALISPFDCKQHRLSLIHI